MRCMVRIEQRSLSTSFQSCNEEIRNNDVIRQRRTKMIAMRKRLLGARIIGFCLFTCFSALLLVLSPAFAQQQRHAPQPNVDQWHLKNYPFDNPNLPTEQRIDNLLSLMTLEEKIDCMSASLNTDRGLGIDTGVPRLGVPNIGSSEGIHGVVQRKKDPGRPPIATTQFPQPPGMGYTWDPNLVREAAG